MATAWRLFYRDGFRAVGIDTLLGEARVAKMTLYHHFASKEELIVAILEQRSAALIAGVDQSLAQAGRSPARRLAAVFDGLKDWFESDDFKGCAFIRALSEYPDPEHPIHRAAWRHKRALNARLRKVAEDAGAKNPAAVADTISLLVDGTIVAAHATRSAAPADQARLAAAHLLKLASA
jgi:AcrR family transcriptional regulator